MQHNSTLLRHCRRHILGWATLWAGTGACPYRYTDDRSPSLWAGTGACPYRYTRDLAR